jgi:hypothetical protein
MDRGRQPDDARAQNYDVCFHAQFPILISSLQPMPFSTSPPATFMLPAAPDCALAMFDHE